MRVSLAVAIALLACSGEADGVRRDEDAGPQGFSALEAHGYRLEITNSFFWSPGPRLTLEPDGSFTGHDVGTLWECEGRFTEDELERLTAALDAADVLRRGDNGPQPCADHPIYHLAIEVTAGPGLGLRNELTYEVCTEYVAALEEVIDAALAPVEALHAAGACTACPVETHETECYDLMAIEDRLCRGNEAYECDSARAGTVVECNVYRSLECVDELGWGPALVWSIDSLTIRRDADPDGTPRIFLTADIAADNRGATNVDLSTLGEHLRFEDPETGTEVPLIVSETATWLGGFQSVVAEPHAVATYALSFNSGTDPGSPMLTLDAVNARLRVRPWETAPWGEPVAVTLVDAAP